MNINAEPFMPTTYHSDTCSLNTNYIDYYLQNKLQYNTQSPCVMSPTVLSTNSNPAPQLSWPGHNMYAPSSQPDPAAYGSYTSQPTTVSNYLNKLSPMLLNRCYQEFSKCEVFQSNLYCQFQRTSTAMHIAFSSIVWCLFKYSCSM
ncbi:uncharacterized protein LOC132737764 [Ruditapes philippinarum]|uniref:uncharacterized protein LOC132737764 n=1 Tax=Ruditapes philippinarum TaxID=129788 RepID=UPI00295C36CB|nr:uncharacterized protein LOC132737764 [Ruditapes philippinarum]